MKTDKLRYLAIDYIKTNKVLKPLYVKMKDAENAKKFTINSTRGYSFEAEASPRTRITIVLPTLRKTKVFGGINTAIKFFVSLVNACGADGRVLVLNNEIGGSKWEYPIDGYSINNDERNISYLPQIKTIKIRRKELFVFTNWRTVYTMLPLFEWRKIHYPNDDIKAVYLIQDYEPGFYPWSSEYALAESTYSLYPESLISVINSKELYDYMNNHNYSFFKMLYFNPVLNDALKNCLETGTHMEKRKKQIIIYGRPSEDRNAFEIIRYALQEWSRVYDGAKEWNIISLGESFGNIKLANNIINVKGKVSLKEYAEIMEESYAGISLMISPHPSYPPLEMSTFGVRTITNCYENKDLSSFNSNLISVKTCTPDTIIKSLCKLCDEYGCYKSEIDVNKEYYSNDTMDSCIKVIKEYVDNL